MQIYYSMLTKTLESKKTDYTALDQGWQEETIQPQKLAKKTFRGVLPFFHRFFIVNHRDD